MGFIKYSGVYYQSSQTYNAVQLQENVSGVWGAWRGDANLAGLANGGGTDWGGTTFMTDYIDCSTATRTLRFYNPDSRTLYYGASFIITKLNPSVTTSTTADNLGNHTATKNIQLSGNYISNDGGNEGIRVDNSGNVGIGTATPNASAILDLSSSTQGVLIPRMTASQRAAIANPVAGLVVYQTNANPGNYVYNGSSWDVLSNANYGDVKTGIQTADHNGWVRLNGRAKTSLSATQQAQATTLGIGATLPNADNSVLMQSSSGTFGIVNGSNSKTITQANLPSYNLPAATSSSNGDHTHWISAATIDNRDFDGTPNNFQQFGLVSDTGSYSINDANRSIGRNTLNAGTHNHNVTVSSGGSGTALDVTPQYLKINTFIYLGF